MEDNFDQNEFEEFLKEQVRNYRMYPTDTVWRDINKKLHGDKKWPALTIAAFTLLSATIAICVYFTPQPDIFTVKPANTELKNSTLTNSQHNIVLDNLASPPSADNASGLQEVPVKNQYTNRLTPESSINFNKNRTGTEVTDQNKILASEKREASETASGQVNELKGLQKETISQLKNDNNKIEVATAKEPLKNESLPLLITDRNEIAALEKIKPLATGNQHVAKEPNDKNMVDNFLKDHKDDISLYTTSKPKSLKNKFSFQIYLAPSRSYRKLVEDKSVLKEGTTNTGPVGLNYVADVNKVVRHKPGNGLEAGVSIMYNLSENFRIKSGFQFNVRQYSIEAYRSSTELASIALVGNNRIDTVNTLAIYRNSNGYYSTELVNRYYQLAIPIGVEWEIVGNKKIKLNVAGSIQPTYLINRNAYLISTNFKNYSENPEMVRSFNINSNIETFLSFKAGYFKWQIGPQLRYQPYSTFIPQYPIKEHLMDYGIKIGLSKTF